MNEEKLEKLLGIFAKIMGFIGGLIVVMPIINIDMSIYLKSIIRNPILLTIVLVSCIYSLIESIMDFRKTNTLCFILKILFFLIIIFTIGIIDWVVIWQPFNHHGVQVNG